MKIKKIISNKILITGNINYKVKFECECYKPQVNDVFYVKIDYIFIDTKNNVKVLICYVNNLFKIICPINDTCKNYLKGQMINVMIKNIYFDNNFNCTGIILNNNNNKIRFIR